MQNQENIVKWFYNKYITDNLEFKYNQDDENLTEELYIKYGIKINYKVFNKKEQNKEDLEKTIKLMKEEMENISKTNITNIKIPIPTIETQKEIVEYLDYIYEISNKTTNEKIKQLKKLNEYCVNNQKKYGKNEIKELGEVCIIEQGDPLTKNKFESGKYKVIGGGKIIGTHNYNNRNMNEITITRVGDININYIKEEYFLTDNGFSIVSNNKSLTITKYIYYILKNNTNYIKVLYNGTAQKVISKTNIKKIKIPIPTIETQKEIVEYCERNEELINELEEEIKTNENNAKNFLNNILK